MFFVRFIILGMLTQLLVVWFLQLGHLCGHFIDEFLINVSHLKSMVNKDKDKHLPTRATSISDGGGE